MIRRGPTIFLRVLVVLGLTIIAGRLAWFQTVKAGEVLNRGDRVGQRNLMPMRGEIVDRNGHVLAKSVPKRTIEAYPRMIADKPGTAAELAPIIGMPEADLLKILNDNAESWYVKVKSDLPISVGQAVEDLTLEGIGVVEEAQRWYPWGSTANHLIGWVDNEGNGASGLELFYDMALRGKPGFVRAEFTMKNTPIENTIETMVPSAPGQTLVLTLDASLQRLMEEHMEKVRKEQDSPRALAMAMDPNTGALLSFAMTPGADLNDRDSWFGADGNLDQLRLNNWGVTPLPVGSIFKALTTSAAIEEGKINPNSVFNDQGLLIVQETPIKNWDVVQFPNYRPRTVKQLMQDSSNVGLIQIGQTMAPLTFAKYLEAFGMTEPTGIDLPGEGAPFLGSDWEDKKPIDWANTYIGQHLEYTPLQILTAWAAVVNGGRLVQPHVVQEIRDPDGHVVKQINPPAKRQVISEQTSATMRDVLVSVLAEGTAKTHKPKGYTAGGKTGTANKFDPVTGAQKDRMVADFIGFAPAENPQAIILILVDEPQGQGYGGMIAAPQFPILLPHVMQAIGIAPSTDAATDKETAPPAAVNGVVPDVRYLPPDWARERLAAAGFTAKFTGAGAVVSTQALTPGAQAKQGTEIELKLLPKEQQFEGKVFVPDLSGYSLTQAHQIAAEIGFVVRASGSGFVAQQEIGLGGQVPLRGSVGIRMAPRP